MKNNALSNALLVFIGVLMVVAALQLMGWGRNTSTLEPEPFDASKLSQLAETAGLPPTMGGEDVLDAITEAPLFSDTRTPFVPTEVVDAGGLEDPPEEADPLKAKVTSIMILGDARYAMILDQLTNEQVTLEQGMPLPGEQGLWVVEHIEPRKVVFNSEGFDPVELELDVFDGQLNAQAATAARNNRASAREIKEESEQESNAEKQKNSAEEIRRKIAERRAQMRANAAKGKENDN